MGMASEHHSDLEGTIRARHSTRQFLSTPVPRKLLMEALSLAQHSPSNSNIQPWHIVIAEGARRDRLREALLAEVKRVPPVDTVLPDEFQHFRQELGAAFFGALGIRREDKEARAAALLRNWEFFGAPLVAIVCIHRDLGREDSMSVGMYVQTLLLALTARGIGSCCEVSLAAYPDVISKELDIAPELAIICGVAIGYTDHRELIRCSPWGKEPIFPVILFVPKRTPGICSHTGKSGTHGETTRDTGKKLTGKSKGN